MNELMEMEKIFTQFKETAELLKQAHGDEATLSYMEGYTHAMDRVIKEIRSRCDLIVSRMEEDYGENGKTDTAD